MGIWRVIGSARLHNLATKSILVFNSTPSGNKLVGIHDIMGMKFASKFIGALVVDHEILEFFTEHKQCPPEPSRASRPAAC
eukprot:1136440-Pelagomonas_calceolata.AAC.2